MTKRIFNNRADWDKALTYKKYKVDGTDGWGWGSRRAFDINGETVGEWIAQFDCDNGVKPHGWLIDKCPNE